tara:strand:- start:10999 stop:11865 length:867 start_codon:yes stop_codon:yes gene_type:complete
MGFSIIIPAYNEDGSIRSVLSSMIKEFDKFGHPYEIIVVNDCSTDRTRDEVVASGLSITLLDHLDNRGYGAAIKTGIKKAKYNLIVISDADGTYPVKMIPELVNTAVQENHDMIVGARTGLNVNIPFIRKPAKWIIGWLANYLSGVKIPDLNSGLRVMKKTILERYIKVLPNGFSLTSTITIAMLTNGHSVKYMPIDYYKRHGKSKIKPIQDTLNFIQLIVRTTLYFNPLKVFVPLSFFLVLFAFLILIGSKLLLDRAMDVSFGVVLMTAVMVMAIGMLADLINKRLP